MDLLYVVIGLIGGLLIIFIFDIAYTAGLYYVCFSLFCKKKLPITKEMTSYGIYFPNLVEFRKTNYSWHLRTIEYQRLRFLHVIGVTKPAILLKDFIVISAIDVKYRNHFRLFDRYKITTKLSYWKDKDFYIETKLEAVNDQSKGAFCTAKFSSNRYSFEEYLKYIVKSKENVPNSPEPSKELKSWIHFNLSSREELRII